MRRYIAVISYWLTWPITNFVLLSFLYAVSVWNRRKYVLKLTFKGKLRSTHPDTTHKTTTTTLSRKADDDLLEYLKHLMFSFWCAHRTDSRENCLSRPCHSHEPNLFQKILSMYKIIEITNNNNELTIKHRKRQYHVLSNIYKNN